MELSIDWLAVLAAVVVGMAVAWVWYADWGLFGRLWRSLTGITEADSNRAGKRPVVVLLLALVATAISLAAASAVVAGFFDDDSIWLHIAVGACAWIGLSASTLLQHNEFEMKPAVLSAINCAYQLLIFVSMAAVIGVIQ